LGGVIRYLLDTNIVSYYLRRRYPELEHRMDTALKRGACAISTMTRAELRFGQALMEPSDSRRELIDLFIARVPNLEWSTQAADHYGQIKALHKREGTPIGELDTQIAAHALSAELKLITHNTRHFARVPRLQVVDWVL
jgi:tRNA(fMet)-specific endonuclease VapC